MKHKPPFFTHESIVVVALLVASLLSLFFLEALIATPKALFGRSLSAIPPSMFPSIVLVALALMCVMTLVIFRNADDYVSVEKLTPIQWIRAFVFFGIMVLYGLTMVPFGFLISTAIATSLISLQMGARSVLQIGAVALIGPILLYLAATRLLAVSLPELNAIEFAYARLLNF